MLDEDWKEIVAALVEAKRDLATAWSVLDGVDGSAPGVEEALNTALEAIDEIYALESQHPANAEVETPIDVRQYWGQHESLPGFAIGSGSKSGS
jgi:hypothetical protein